MPENDIQIRQKRLLDAIDREGLDALVLNAGPSLSYLTGLDVHLSERPVLAIFRTDGVPIIVLPSLEAGKLEHLSFEARSHTYGEDPSTWSRTFDRAVTDSRLNYRRVGVESLRMRVLELRLLEEAAPSAAYLDADDALSSLRSLKDESEVASMRKAVKIAERALEKTLPYVKAGITEKELASMLTGQLFSCGSASELPFAPIVAFGDGSANPHAVPTDRALDEGDLILIDWGASAGGYFSDMTRVFSLGTPPDKLAELADVVAEANQAARQTAGPDATAADVDRAARHVIEQAGFGDHFIHRTGHGLGLDVHETPYIRSDNDELLLPGMTFTIEPGIYVPGLGGVRIEDDVVITDDGMESLTSLDRSLRDVSERRVASTNT